MQKEHSIEDLLNFLIVFLISLLLKHNFLKQHKTDLEQYPLAPTSNAKSSTHQPLGGLLQGIFVPFFTNFIDDLVEMGTASFIFKMKVLRASMTLYKTVSCLNVYLPCCSDTLQAPKICPVVHTSLLQRVHMASVVILHLLKVGRRWKCVICRS